MNANVIFYACAFFLIIKLVVQIYLGIRNDKNIDRHRNEVPEEFKDYIDLEEHQKAATYSLTKASFGRISLFYNTALLVFWLMGGLEVLDMAIRAKFKVSEIQLGLIYIALYSLIGMVLSLPFSIYNTFVLEEKFGFNKTTPKTFIMDMIKQTILGAIIALPLFALILWVMEALGSSWWIVAWAIMTGFQFFMIWAYPRFIAPMFNKFSPLEEGELKDKIQDLLEKTGFESNGLFVMDASKRSGHGNAYFTGFGKSKRIVFFDTLLNSLTPLEAQAVLAHELGHFKLKHIHKNMIMSLTTSFIGFAILGWAYSHGPFYEAFYIKNASTYMGLILFMKVVPIFTFLLTPIFSLLSRKHEFEADEFAAKYSSGQELINALLKLYKENSSTLTPDPLYSKFYYSHPPAFERVAFLKSKSANT